MDNLGGSSPATVGGKEGFITPAPAKGGRRHRGHTIKALKKTLKKAGLKTTGKKAALSRRVKKAHLKVGGAFNAPEGAEKPADESAEGMLGKEAEFEEEKGGRRRSRGKNGLVRGVYRGVTGVAKGTLRNVGRVGKAVFGRGGRVKKH